MAGLKSAILALVKLFGNRIEQARRILAKEPTPNYQELRAERDEAVANCKDLGMLAEGSRQAAEAAEARLNCDCGVLDGPHWKTHCSAFLTAEAERDEARADRDNFSALLSADNLAEEELRARAEAAEKELEQWRSGRWESERSQNVRHDRDALRKEANRLAADLDLDALEKRATEAIWALYGEDNMNLPAARFWAQKGIEGMRLAVAEVLRADAEHAGEQD
jgi:hypothetical protein